MLNNYFKILYYINLIFKSSSVNEIPSINIFILDLNKKINRIDKSSNNDFSKKMVNLKNAYRILYILIAITKQ